MKKGYLNNKHNSYYKDDFIFSFARKLENTDFHILWVEPTYPHYADYILQYSNWKYENVIYFSSELLVFSCLHLNISYCWYVSYKKPRIWLISRALQLQSASTECFQLTARMQQRTRINLKTTSLSCLQLLHFAGSVHYIIRWNWSVLNSP